MAKCYNCKKKLTLVEKSIICNCNHKFCLQHRIPENHNCCYDYSKYKVNIEGCVREKILKI